jgi:putative protease
MMVIKPEIMSPAGYWPQLQTAIEAGADAVYFGLKHFTARAKVGFTLAELPEVMRTLHRRGVKGYVTFNTLIFEHELAAAARSLAAIAAADADAIIVQDIAAVQLARQIAPTLEVHGSTQMSITSAEGVALAQHLGVSRVVLARELSLEDIRKIRGATDVELEMFVHGALCVSYSGQCFSSEAWGGRSANRGQCAQACRLPYGLIVDGVQRPLGDARYLLSPEDLYALELMPEIVQLGVSALKIEGRYKDSDYVALTTAAYRKAVDEAWAGRPLSVSVEERLRLEQVYSRGLGAHFVSGTNHQRVVQGRAPRHRGVLAGRVARVLRDRVHVELDARLAVAPLKPGDGVVFDAADWRSPEEREEGGRIYHVREARTENRALRTEKRALRTEKRALRTENREPFAQNMGFAPSGAMVELEFGNGAVDFRRVRVGDLLWRSSDPELAKLVRPYTDAQVPLRRQAMRVAVRAHEGEVLRIDWTLLARPEIHVTVHSVESLPRAQNRAVSEAYLRDQLGRLGNTAYELAEFAVDIVGEPFAPSSLLNQLRREAVEQLAELQEERRELRTENRALRSEHSEPRTEHSEPRTEHSRPSTQNRALRTENPGERYSPFKPQPSALSPQPLALHLLVRTAEQLEVAIALRPASITLDYLELYGLAPAVERVHGAGIEARVASPRVLKPDEQRVVRFLLKLGCPILVRSSGLLYGLRAEARPPLVGDFSLNASNSISATALFELGLERLTPTHDLNAAQIGDLARAMGGERIEAIVYQHLPVFHTEHCVFCRFLSTGTSYQDCGHPCEQHRVALRDEQGRAHPVMADVGCRNTVFSAEAQEASRHLDEFVDAGIRHFRLEFVHESVEAVQAIGTAFREALNGKISAAVLEQRLRGTAPQGTTEGSLFVPGNYLSIPLMQ